MAMTKSLTTALVGLSLVYQVRAWTPELPACLSPFQPFVYTGCYKDTCSPDTLSMRTTLPSDNMTVEICTAECKGNGYRYAGLEYYGNCYCGQTIRGDHMDDSKCSYSCNGNHAEKCGGSNFMSIWSDPTF